MLGLVSILLAGCRRPEPPVDTAQRDATGLSFDQLFDGIEHLDPGGAIQGEGHLYLYLLVSEGSVDGQVFARGGDITVDGRAVPEDQALPIEGRAWWLDDARTCFDAWFYAPAADALEAVATGCRGQIWVDVALGPVGDVEEEVSLGISAPYDPFFYESER